MKKFLLGVLLGATVYFIWGMVSWMVLPWHSTTMKKVPEEQLITDTLKTVITEPGFYFFPSHDNADGQMDNKAWAEKYRQGPIGVMAFSPTGKEPMGPLTFFFAILGDIAVALLSMLILALSRDRVTSTVPRALLTGCLGLLVGMAAHVPYWNWFNFPLSFTIVSIVDGTLGFFFMGLAQAKFVSEGS